MSVTRYKLPDWLGGCEVDVRGTRGDGQLIVIPRGPGSDGLNPTSVHIDRDQLVEVPPPLPPVPDAPAVLIGNLVWCRDDIKDEGPVFVLPGGPTLNWAELNAHAAAQGKPIIPLVPDPAAPALTLPWECDDEDGDELRIEPTSRTDLAAFIKTSRAGVRLTAADARLAAAALLRAAREVEQS